LGILGAAYEEMRDALAGRNYVADYVQTLTHELKSPLSAIRGAAELLHEPGMPAADRKRFLGNIERETQRIQELVDRMMELAALESRHTLQPRAGGAAPLLHELAPAPGGRASRRARRARRRPTRSSKATLPAAPRGGQPGRQRDRLLARRRCDHAGAAAARPQRGRLRSRPRSGHPGLR
jgi:signal transduction histidine kinase